MTDKDIYLIKYCDNINLQEVLNDFIENFTRKKCILKISDKKLQNVEIRFSKNNLPHLLGLHKINKKRAPKILIEILEGTMTHSSIKTHHNYSNIKDRLYSYNFLHKCFIEKNINYCIVVKNNVNNQLDLDVVFIDNFNNKLIVLGLRKVQHYFVPTTMYVMKNQNDQYNLMPRSKINCIEWCEY